jgi:hypothetical protein
VRWGCNIDEGDELSGKRDIDLTKVRWGHTPNVSHHGV